MTNENQIVYHNKKKQTADPGDSEKRSAPSCVDASVLNVCVNSVFLLTPALRPKTCMTDGGKHGRRRYWPTWIQCFIKVENWNPWLRLLLHFFGGWLLTTSQKQPPSCDLWQSQCLTQSTLKRTEITHTLTHTGFHFMVGFLPFAVKSCPQRSRTCTVQSSLPQCQEKPFEAAFYQPYYRA